MLHVNHAWEPHVNLDSFTLNAALHEKCSYRELHEMLHFSPRRATKVKFFTPWYLLCFGRMKEGCNRTVLTHWFSVCRRTGQDSVARKVWRPPCRPGGGAVTPSPQCASPSDRTGWGATAAICTRIPRAPHPAQPPAPRPPPGQTAPSQTTALKHKTQTHQTLPSQTTTLKHNTQTHQTIALKNNTQTHQTMPSHTTTLKHNTQTHQTLPS